MESIWSQTCEIQKREPLNKDIGVEVAVIGAGLCGVLAAYLLQKAGRQVVILEAGRIAGGQTRNTTAKITSQHGFFYHQLISGSGEKAARLYAEANEKAIGEYRRIIKDEAIDCDFENMCAFLYSQDPEILEKEARAAVSLGLPASLVKSVDIPLPCAGAVKFGHQAQFHPLKFIKAVAKDLEIYEKTPVKKVEGGRIETDSHTVTAGQVVFACHYPFVNFPGMYFARMHQERSYVLALEHAPVADGMYLGTGSEAYSMRSYKNLLLFGGEGHRTGENSLGGRYDALRKKALELFPGCREAACWSAQDCVTVDQVPYIGQYAPGRKNWYVATGFKKWGMTSSMVSALILRDLLCGEENPYADVFAPGRMSMRAAAHIMNEGAHAVKGLTRRIFARPDKAVDALPSGHGGIVSVDGEKLGVYKDENGDVYAVDVRCPHLGCQLEWNPDEKSWDCPCHGSRFDFRGRLISDPAQEGVKA